VPTEFVEIKILIAFNMMKLSNNKHIILNSRFVVKIQLQCNLFGKTFKQTQLFADIFNVGLK
jgi:hypothetical protein